MDEKQIKPNSRQPILLRILRPITAVLLTITLLTTLFIFLDYLLPFAGVTLNFDTHGNSMDPTIRGNAFVVISTAVPFEELNPSDVILFKEPKGLNTATDSIRVHISKVGENENSSSSSASDNSPTVPEPEMNTVDEAPDIEYLPDRAVLHRIVDIKNTEDGQTLLITKGDANPYLDRYPVNSDAYLGRMLWHVDYIGEVLLFLYNHFDLITVMTVVVTMATALLSLQFRSSHKR